MHLFDILFAPQNFVEFSNTYLWGYRAYVKGSGFSSTYISHNEFGGRSSMRQLFYMQMTMHTTQTQQQKKKGKQKLRRSLCTSLFKFWSHYLETCIKHKHWHDFMLLDALHKFGIAHSVAALRHRPCIKSKLSQFAHCAPTAELIECRIFYDLQHKIIRCHRVICKAIETSASHQIVRRHHVCVDLPFWLRPSTVSSSSQFWLEFE